MQCPTRPWGALLFSPPSRLPQPPQGPGSLTECQVSPHPWAPTKDRNCRGQTRSRTPQAVVSSCRHPRTSLPRVMGCWEGKQAPKSAVSKLGLATCGDPSNGSTRAQRSWLKNRKGELQSQVVAKGTELSPCLTAAFPCGHKSLTYGFLQLPICKKEDGFP